MNPNTGALLDSGPKNSPACHKDDSWTILKGGFSVSCQWDLTEKRCRGYGAKADACKRNYQAVDDAVFAEKLAELPDGFFQLDKMGHGIKGGELNDNKPPEAMNGQNKKVPLTGALASKVAQ
jgi:hypothetical protein